MTKFIQEYDEIQGSEGRIIIKLREEEQKLNDLILLYEDKKANNTYLLESLDGEYSLFWNERNLLLVLEKLIESGSLKDLEVLKKIREIVVKKISNQIKNNNEHYIHYLINFLLNTNISLEEIEEHKDLFVTANALGRLLEHYQEKELRTEFNRVLKDFVLKFQDLFSVGTIHNESFLKYIATDKEASKVFILSLQENIHFLEELSGFWYSHHKEYWQKILKKNKKTDLIRFCKNIIKIHFEGKYRKLGSAFKDLLGDAIKECSVSGTFSDWLFDFILEKEFYPNVIEILYSSLNEENIGLFLEKERPLFVILNLHELYRKSDNEIEGQLGEKLYEKYKTSIEENEKRNMLYREEEMKRTSKENEKNIKRIKTTIEENKKDSSKETYHILLLELYKQHAELFSEEDKKLVIKETEHILRSINLRKKDITLTRTSESGYTRSGLVPALKLAINVASSLGIKLGKYQKTVVSLFPYMYSSESDFWNIVKDEKIYLDEEDMERLLNIYNKKIHGDLWTLHPRRFVDLKEYGLLNDFLLKKGDEVLEIIKNYLLSTDRNISNDIKITYLDFIKEGFQDISPLLEDGEIKELYGNLKSKYAQYNFFDDYLRGNIPEESEDYQLFIKFNEVFILLLKDNEAIKWRLQQLLGIKKDCLQKDYIGITVRTLESLEKEYEFGGYERDAHFYQPLIDILKFEEYQKKIKNILDHAKTFSADRSLVQRYLYGFCKLYYVKVPKDKRAEVYSNLNNSEFVSLYLKEFLDEKGEEEYMKLWYKKKYLEFENNLKLNDSLRKKEKEHYTKSLYKKQYLELEGRLKIEEDKKLSYKNKYYEVLEELDSYKKKESKKKEAEEWEKVKRPGLDVCLYVEGKTDKKYIEMAYQELYNESPNFKILPVGGAELVSTHISSVIAEEIPGIHIGILDWDNAGTKNWMMLNHDNQSDIHLKWVKRVKNGIFENKNKIQTSYCALILIPYREDFRDHIFLDFKKGSKEGVIKDKGSDAIEVDDNYQFLVNHRVIGCDTKGDGKPMFYPTFSIEHLLYNDDSKTYFKEYAPYGEEGFKLKISDKNKLSKNIENLNIPRSVRENFKPLFEYIDDIVSEKCG